VSSGIASQDQLFTINLTTGAATDIAEIHGSSNFDVNGLLYRSDGMLVGVEDDSNSLVVIDPHTGDVTTLASLPLTVDTAGAIFLQAARTRVLSERTRFTLLIRPVLWSLQPDRKLFAWLYRSGNHRTGGF
jgi:hypothetical protein